MLISEFALDQKNHRFRKFYVCAGVVSGLMLFASVLPVPQARAIDGSTTLTPTWDNTARRLQNVVSCIEYRAYVCEDSTLTRLQTLSEPALGCNDDSESDRIALAFDLSGIPNTARITGAQLSVYVSSPSASQQTVRRIATDTPASLSCSTPDLFEALATGPTYASFENWSTSGLTTATLSVDAVTDIQSRISHSDKLALGISTIGTSFGSIFSADAPAAFRPQLVVTYSLTPELPTNFTVAGATTSSITWSWVEHALFETNNLVQTDTHSAVCSAGPRTGENNALVCTETGLQPNTRYSRHPNAIDPAGSTDGATIASYTAIETPSSVAVTGFSSTGMTLKASGNFSDLKSNFSGVNLAEITTGASSGWNQTNDWTVNGLTPNAPYTFRAQARNSLGLETPWSGVTTKFTLSRDAGINADRATGTWSTSQAIRFANTSGWGRGGVQYYRYTWNANPSYPFVGNEPMWGDSSNSCPGACNVAGETLSLTAPADGGWYFHVQPYNGDNLANGAATYGPFYYDGTAPNAPRSLTIASTNKNGNFTNDLSTLHLNWEEGSDTTSGLAEYRVALGTEPGAANVLPWTAMSLATSTTLRGLTLRDGTTYYAAVAAVDVAGSVSATVSSTGTLANTQSPRIIDRQTGDSAHRRTGGTLYNVDFTSATTGPDLTQAQYTIYSQARLGGQARKAWTAIFDNRTGSYTANWRIDFSALAEGINYVSVRVTSLDGFTTQQSDVFTVVKDSSPAPTIRGVNVASFSPKSPTVELLILGSNYRSGAVVMVGNQRAKSVKLTRRGMMTAVFSPARLGPGAYDLRIINPNGLTALRKKRVYIVNPRPSPILPVI